MRRGGQGFNGQGTAGNITAISGDTLTLKTLNGVETVKTTSDTMFRREREAAKLADFKVGDTVFVMGDKSGDTWTARMVASVTQEWGPYQASQSGRSRRRVASTQQP